MSDIRQVLTDVLSGAQPPEAFLAAVDEFLAKPNANIAALRSLIDAAEKNGLPQATADAARAKLAAGNDLVDIGDPTRAVEEDNADRTVVMNDDDAATQLRADPADIDRTVFTGGPDSDKTEFTGGPDSDKTEVTGAGPDDRTVATGDDDETVQVGGDDPFAMTGGAAAQPDELGPGSVLKGRFRLEQVIGQGGMGAVYKAVDLLKVEARDRNPYIAVKLLVGDFKEHPEAFIALQRESAKAQRLAHPNIATVYDFDRDGETVYMTMELMVGAELAKYIKKLPAGGLSVPDAVRIIEQLCAGLQYAHARGLVHSDFKPGNAFVLDDGSVKLLDFGIARASKTQADADGEKTVFDPGELGALTPAYATIEMFEGQDPDPRDDIYALAAVTYELFTGKHPFNKMSAVKAKEKGLKPAPIAKLNKRQNKAMFKALALHRDDRTPSVEEFWEGIRPRKDYTLHIAAGATAATLLLGALLYNPILDLIHNREYDAIAVEIGSGDEARFLAGLESIETLPNQERRDAAAQRAREAIFAYFFERANTRVNELDYPGALSELQRAQTYLRNDVPLANEINTFRNNQRDAALGVVETIGNLLIEGTREEGQSAAAHRAKLETTLLPNEERVDLPEAVAQLKRIDPEHNMLSDPRIADQYAVLAGAAADANQWQRAGDILAIANEISPDSPNLRDIGVEVSGELRREQEAAQVATLRRALEQARPRTIDEFRAVSDELQQLGELRPDDTVVRGLDAALRDAVRGAVNRHTQAGEWNEADAVLAEFARALPLDFLIATRHALTEQQISAGYESQDPARAERRAELFASLNDSLTNPDFEDISFGRALTNDFKQFTALADSDRAAWQAMRERITITHIEAAAALAERDFYRQAASVLEQGTQFHSGFPAFANARASLAAAEAAYADEQARRLAIARIETEKKKVTDLAEAGNADAATTYQALVRQLDPNDPFIERGAAALEAMYLTMASNLVNDNPGRAVELLEGGLRNVDRSALRQRRDEYQLLANAAAVTAAVSRLTEAGFPAWRNTFMQARDALPQDRRPAFENAVVGAFFSRLNELNNQSNARPLRELAVELFSGQQRQRLSQMNLREPSRFAAGIRSLIDDKKLTEAEAALADAERAERSHPQLAGFSAEIARKQQEAQQHYERARDQRNTNQNAAQQAIAQALAIWADNETYNTLSRQLVGTVARNIDDGSRPCTTAHATRGRAVNGRCYDVVAPRDQAPSLVVVPALAGGEMFAISRQEITVEDFNKFCTATGSCQAIGGDGALPVTDISIQMADAYAAWLSEVTGKTYRIPTGAEWTHAAGAAGNAGVAGNYNCTVIAPSGAKQKGHAVQRATAGEQNGWGLLNVLGNVQEWTRDGGTVQARGASHNDSLSDCRVDFARPHAGTADAMTGFRIVRIGGIE